MNISRSICLICLNLVLLIPGGCYMSRYSSGGSIEMSGSEYQELRAFPPGFSKALYNAKFTIKGREFSGLMMIKAYDDHSYKIAFFSELGLNFFDFGLLPSEKNNKLTLYVNNIYSPLDHDVLLKSFEKYFSMLLSPALEDGAFKTFLKKDGSTVMVMVSSFKGKDAYLSKNLIEPYSEIVNMSRLFVNDRISISVSTKKIKFCPESIIIDQPALKMRFSLSLLNEP